MPKAPFPSRGLAQLDPMNPYGEISTQEKGSKLSESIDGRLPRLSSVEPLRNINQTIKIDRNLGSGYISAAR